MPRPSAYIPLATYPEAAPDAAILNAIAWAAALGRDVHVATFAADIPAVAAPLGGFILNVEGLVRAAEERSTAAAERLRALVGGAGVTAVAPHRTVTGAIPEIAAAEARYHDLALLPWDTGAAMAQDLAQGVVFGAGRPVILVPPAAPAAAPAHVAIAWDESRVAARALADALALLPAGGRVTVLTLRDDKPLSGGDPAQALAGVLRARGIAAAAQDVPRGAADAAITLQEAAIAAGADLLAMGGFGHSRLRDFVLGGVTRGVLSDLRLPVLLSH